MVDSPLLLMIDTGSELCSVALSKGNELIDEVIIEEPRAHSRVIGPLVFDILNNNGFVATDCDAFVVCEGPGSYTGLRVGVSVAKGLCFGADRPLIAVSSPLLIARLAIERNLTPEGCTAIYSVLDARRDEVYLGIFSAQGEILSPIEAVVVNKDSFSEALDSGIILFAGNGAAKLSAIISHPNARFARIESIASGMLTPALNAFRSGEFADTAYFEPLYLKDFIAGTAKKRLF